MSVVIAIRDKDRVIIGSDKQVSTGVMKDHSCTKIWNVSDLDGAIMGGVGSARASQVIQYSNIIDKNSLHAEPTTEFVICALAPAIAITLKEAGIKLDAREDASCLLMPNAFIFAYKDRAWMIWNDLSVTEIGDYFAIGSGSEVAMGVLYATAGKNPFERIVTCIDAAAESILFVDHGIDLLTTKTYLSDAKIITKVLGFEDSAKETNIENRSKTKKVKQEN